MTEQQFQILLEQYITGTISSGDRERLLLLLDDAKYSTLLEKAMEKEWHSGVYEETANESTGLRLEAGLMQRIRSAKVVPLHRTPVRWMSRIAVAAILLLLIGGGYFLLRSTKAPDQGNNTIARVPIVKDIIPGSNKAFLLVGNGDTLTLDNNNRGIITQQGSAKLEQKGAGLLAYEVQNNDGKFFYNTLYTPKGGQYRVKLSDGTDVWLNAGSSLRFPTAFTENERNVQLTGEAYFEVAHDTKKSFIVEANGVQVKVLGTHFNINSYKNDTVWKTTLVQGKIEIWSGLKKAVLAPGNQARIQNGNGLSVIQKVDTEEVVAWKNGYFQFKNAAIETVMNQISRWYDVEIMYKGLVRGEHFTGTISRTMPTADMLHLLDVSGIHCRIQDGKIVVMP